MNNYGELLENESLKKYNTYKIGGISKYIIKPYDIDNLKKLLKYLKENNIKYIVLGKGSNIILPDEDYNGVIILLDKISNIEIEDNIVTSYAGVTLNKLITDTINNNLCGFENLYGIPGTLGGAIIGNAGCNGSTISDNLISVTYLENNELKEISKEDCDFKYRNSMFKGDKNKIVISAKFKLNTGNKEELMSIIKEKLIKRKNSQPLEYPNAGSVFKNPTNDYAGRLIESVGLKGFNIGGAFISDKHANFIINKNNATKKDIVDLINLIQDKVEKNYNIKLELEQEIIKF